MTRQDEVRGFLTTRRARITPEQVGLTVLGGERRVPGLRREEVALLAGVSVDYYTRLERGRIRGASDSVLDSLARALRLTAAERDHLFALARGHTASAPRRVAPACRVRASVQRILDALDVPAVAQNPRQDLIAANELGRALYVTPFDSTDQPPNLARFVFLDHRAQAFYPNWNLACRITAAALRAEAVRTPLDPALTALIDDLGTESPVFREVWAHHEVRAHHTGLRQLRHPVVGDLSLAFEVLDVQADQGLSIVVHSAGPTTPTAAGLVHLSRWAAESRQASASDAETVRT
ncbi:helix-turn-helix domain-containing protein [Streptomyces canus]|uniref:helix-turn-helix domain-containing protein n=1 Tax=Streptomyces canus TaxID=58343 RepID=UPI0022593182|nr:helix-turn-helix transcriptional regulator [Streptomyces canus]MCX4862119.1 helix-turn-helix transcriptional regulator [Streptomyces canus]